MIYSCLLARPPGGDARIIIALINDARACLPRIHSGRIDEHPRTVTISCSSFERGCQCLAHRDHATLIGLGVARFQANRAHLQVHSIPAQSANLILLHAGVVAHHKHKLEPILRSFAQVNKLFSRKYAISHVALPLQTDDL
jgi:hypothetical protein